MTLIISKEGKTVRLEKQHFENEAALQKYIYECPEAIPLDEVSPDPLNFRAKVFSKFPRRHVRVRVSPMVLWW
jgi:hypothetical protein